MNTLLLTATAMLAFAANSLLCRQALAVGLIDAVSFTAIRVASGALMLGLLVALRRRAEQNARADWRMVAALFAYMVFFSVAYLSLTAGTGALILFAAVQLTMFVVAMRAGERFPIASWLGFGLAVGGLVYLVAPGVAAPDPLGAVLMAIAGIAWGAYSLLGRSAADPLSSTAWNFIYAVPFAAGISLLALDGLHLTAGGAALAVASGAIASGLGYFAWYTALRGLTAMRAATVQLSVPALAAVGGVLLLDEALTLRLVLASVATLGGIALILRQRAAG